MVRSATCKNWRRRWSARCANAHYGPSLKVGRLKLSPTDLRLLQYACHQFHDRFVQVHGPILMQPPAE
jgi:hypothetical protein